MYNGACRDAFTSKRFSPWTSSSGAIEEPGTRKEPPERSWIQILWLLAKDRTATVIAESTGYARYWIGQIARRYNQEGPTGMQNRRATHSHRAQPLLSSEQLAELAEALRGPAPDGDDWIGRTVAAWISAKLGRPVSVYLGWAYLVRLEGKRRRPRPRHVQADPVAQETFKKAETAAARGGDRLSAGAGRTLGHRRASHWPLKPQTDPAQDLVFRRPAPQCAG